MHGFFKKQGCEDIKEQLSAYIDGQVTSSEKASIEKHLTSCEPCREELTSLRATKSVLSLMPSVAIPRSFNIVSYRPVPRTAPFSILRLATAATAFLLMLVWIGDYWNVYPKAPVSGLPPVTTAAPAPTPAATPEPTPAPVPSGTPPGGVPRPRGVVPPVTPVPATPAAAPVSPETPAVQPPAAPAAATPPGQVEYAWPIRQIEYVLVAMVAALSIAWVIASKWAYARNKRN